MAELVIPEGYGNLVFKWQIDGHDNPFTTTLGVRVTEPSTPSEIVDEAFDDIAATDCPCDAGKMNSFYTFLGVEGKFMTDIGLVGAASSQSPVEGTMSSTSLVLVNTCFLIQKRTTLIGRKYRGRNFAPCLGMTEGAIDYLGTIGEVDYGIQQDIWAGWFANALEADISYTPVILHSDSTVPTVITSMNLQGKVATQRRRMR